MLDLGTMLKRGVLVIRSTPQGINIPVGWLDKKRLIGVRDSCVAGTDARVMTTSFFFCRYFYPRVRNGSISQK